MKTELTMTQKFVFSLAEVKASGKTANHFRKKHKYKVDSKIKSKSKKNIGLLKKCCGTEPDP